MNSSATLTAPPARGSQQPRYLSLPPGKPDRPNDFADRGVMLARLAGLNLDPWQELTLRSMLRTAPESNRWAAYESLILVPRQNGKSVTLEAFDLAKLYLSPPGHMIMHTAHLFPTAMESFRHLSGLIKNTPELNAEVVRWSNAHGSEGIELRNGSRLRFAARGVNGAGRGFSPDDVIFDEAYRLPAEAEEALLYAISAKPNPQLVYASSTGFPDSDILWSLVQRGRTGSDPSLMMAEWSADPDLDISDEDQMWRAVAQANPALGYRLTVEKTGAEYRKAASQGRLEGYGRERLGLWAETATAGVFVPGSWESCTDRASKIEGAPGFAVDTSVDRRSSSVSVCGAREDGLPHLETVENRPGTDWITAYLVEKTEMHGGFVVIDPASPAGSLVDDLKAAGVLVYTVTARDYAQACGWLYDAVKDRTVRHLGQSELDAAVAGARLRDLAGGFAWDRKKPLSDITPLVSATLACWGYRTYGGDLSGSVW